MKMPISELMPTTGASAAEVIGMSTANRNVIRLIPSLSIPCEQKIRSLKRQLASSHGTATGIFHHEQVTGAYLTDPLLFINTVAASSTYIAVGGDSGGEATKIGITYTNARREEEFDSLVVLTATDDWEGLNTLSHIGVTHFIGQSAAFLTIWSLFQSLVCTRSLPPHQQTIFFNGDWKFLNTILGLKSPSSTHPCPICLVDRSDLLSRPRNRTPSDFTFSQLRVPLFIIPADFIVPTPLHILLGLGNKIIRKVLPQLSTDEWVKEAMSEVKSTHATNGSIGRANVHELNGVELSKWIEKEFTLAFIDPTSPSPIVQLDHWLKGIYKHLLHKREWSEAEKDEFRSLVFDIQFDWRDATNTNPIPKVHMLTASH
jgi:hypothetical protein